MMGDRSIAVDGGNSEISPTPSVPWYESTTSNHAPMPALDTTNPAVSDLPNITFNFPGDTPSPETMPGSGNLPGSSNLPGLDNAPGLRTTTPATETPHEDGTSNNDSVKPKESDNLGINYGGDLAALGYTASAIGLQGKGPLPLRAGIAGAGSVIGMTGIALGYLKDGNMTSGDELMIGGFGLDGAGVVLRKLSTAVPELRPIGIAAEFLGKAGVLSGTLLRFQELGKHYDWSPNIVKRPEE